MPRAPRVHYEGAILHLTVRGNRGEPVFRSPDDHRSFLALLRDAGERCAWTLLSYCLMPNHIHLLVRVGDQRISGAMGTLLTTHAARFNKVHATHGHVFGERYHATEVEYEEHLLEAFRYIAANPRRAGLVGSAEQWEWSAHPALVGLVKPAAGVNRDAALAYFDGIDYRQFVLNAPDGLGRLFESGLSNPFRRALAHGYTQAELAVYLQVNQSTISRWIRAEKPRRIKGD